MAHNIEAVLRLKDDMSATLKVAEGNLKRFGGSLKYQGNQLRKFGNTLGYLGKDILSLNAPFLALGGWASKLGIDFESVTSEAQAIMQATSSEMEVFKEKAREVGAVTSKSATESMDGIKLLGQAGLDQKEILELTYPLVRLSEAGNLGMARSADLLTNSMKSAEIPMKNVGQYLDQIALAGNESNTSIEQQLEAWNSAGGAINSANMKMSEANALFGILANRGVKGAQAGNTVSRVFQNLNATSGEAGKAMKALGISVQNSDGSMRNKIDVLKELKAKTDKMTEAQREQYLTMIGGKAHTENLKKILSGLGNEYDDLESKLSEANGALEKMAITMKDNLKGKLETLSSASEEFGLKLADILLPRVEKVVDKVQSFVDKLNEMDDQQLDSIINIVLFTTKLAFLLIGLSKVSNMIGSFTKNIGDLILFFSEGSNFAGMFGVSGLKLLGIIGIIGLAIGLLVKNWDSVKEAAKRAKEAVTEYVTENFNIDLIKEKFNNLKFSFRMLFDAAKRLGSVLLALGKVIFEFVLKIASSVGEALLDNLPGIFENLITAFDGLIEFIKGIVFLIISILTGDLGGVMDSLADIWTGGINLIQGLWRGLIHILSVPIEATVKLIEGRFPFVAKLIRGIWSGLKSFLLHPIQAMAKLKDMASSKMQKVRENWSRTKSRLSSALKARVTALTESFQQRMEGVKKKWEEVKSFLKNPIKGTVNLAQRGANWVKSKVGRNWQGTSSWRGGLTTLHEKGGEIYDLPKGTRVYPHDKSVELARKEGMAMASSNSSSFNINKLADTIIVREESDIDKIAEALARKLEDARFNTA